MRLFRMVITVLFVAAGLAFPAAAAAAQTPSVKGGGTTQEMTQLLWRSAPAGAISSA